MKLWEEISFYNITRTWDAIILWRVESREHLCTILKKVGSHIMVVRTSSQLILNTHKPPLDFNPLNSNKSKKKVLRK
jgi:hypothetical protein